MFRIRRSQFAFRYSRRLPGRRGLRAALVAAGALLSPAPPASAQGADPALVVQGPPAASPARVAALVQQLAASDWNAREAAMRELIAIGEPAVPALEAALGGEDAEVRARAVKVLDTVRLGITPALRAKVGNLLEGFGAMSAEEKQRVVARLAREADVEAVPVLERILRAEKDPAVRGAAQSWRDRLAAARDLDLVLTSGANAVKADEPFDVTATFRNQAKGPIMILRPIDGCGAGWRVVAYEWSVTDARGRAVSRRSSGRCGNVNAIQKADLVTLANGASYDVKTAGSFLSPVAQMFDLSKPGTYKITLTYAFDPDRKERGIPLGNNEAGVDDLLKKATIVRKTSSALTIEVKAE